MTFRPGKRLVIAMGGLVVFAIGTFVWSGMAVGVALGVVALLVAAEIDRRRLTTSLESLSVERKLPTVIGRGQTFVTRLTIKNAGGTTVAGELRDVLPDEAEISLQQATFHIDPGGSHEIEQSHVIPIRGQYVFGPVWIRASGLWQLVEAQRDVACPGSIRVLPETFASNEKLLKDVGAQLQLLDKITRSRQHGTGTEFESLHPFREGDDPRRIDWRATAKHGDPIIRRFQVERHRDVMILIDCGRLMGSQTDTGSKLDCAVDAALNLSRVVLQSGDRCGVAAYDQTVRGFLPPQAGINSLGKIVESVFDLQSRWSEADFTQIHAAMQARQSKRSLLVVLSDLSDVETSRLQCTALRKLGKRHLVLFAALRTPLLNRVARRIPRDVAEGAEQAVAYRLIRERSQALQALEKSGVHVLDVEPSELTMPLINQFVDLRQRNLL